MAAGRSGVSATSTTYGNGQDDRTGLDSQERQDLSHQSGQQGKSLKTTRIVTRNGTVIHKDVWTSYWPMYPEKIAVGPTTTKPPVSSTTSTSGSTTATTTEGGTWGGGPRRAAPRGPRHQPSSNVVTPKTLSRSIAGSGPRYMRMVRKNLPASRAPLPEPRRPCWPRERPGRWDRRQGPTHRAPRRARRPRRRRRRKRGPIL